MGVGPIEAVRKVLAQAGMTIDDVDVMELNEAFAAQVLPVCRELGVDPFGDKLNPHGGAIALGHPYGMTGARIMNTLLNDLDTLDRTIGLETMCVGGGQGMAMLVERLARRLGALALALAVGSSIVWGAADFAGGSLTKRLPTLAVTVLSQTAGFAALIVIGRGPRRGRRKPLRPRLARRNWRRSGAGGVLPRPLARHDERRLPRRRVRGRRAVRDRDRHGGRPSGLALTGAGAALGGAVLASVEERRAAVPERARAIVLALVAAVALGLFVYFLGLGSRHGDALSTLLGARVGSLTVLVALASARRAPLRIPRHWIVAVTALGLADVTANALFAFAAGHGLLALVSVLGSLYPVVTVLPGTRSARRAPDPSSRPACRSHSPASPRHRRRVTPGAYAALPRTLV